MTDDDTSIGRRRTLASDQRRRLGLRALIGSGDRIGLFVLPIAVIGLVLNIAFPAAFAVGGPPRWLQVTSAVLVTAGVIVWAWSVRLLLTQARAGELITTGPYAMAKHPLYTAVALLVLPWAGFLLDTWIGALIGAALYTGSRLFAPAEEVELAERFGAEWTAYDQSVRFPWL